MTTCSECGFDLGSQKANFCPKCGARIKGVPSTAVSDSFQGDIDILEEKVASGLGPHPLRTIGVLLLLVIVICAAFYVVSYNSARSFTIQTESVTESYRTGLLGYVEVDIKVKVMSNSFLDLTLSQVSFGLTVDDIPFQSVQVMGCTLSSTQYEEYTMRFTSYDSNDAQYVSQNPTQNIAVSITAWVTSGWYSGWVSASYSKSYTFY